MSTVVLMGSIIRADRIRARALDAAKRAQRYAERAMYTASLRYRKIFCAEADRLIQLSRRLKAKAARINPHF